jgi:hypothetical protein
MKVLKRLEELLETVNKTAALEAPAAAPGAMAGRPPARTSQASPTARSTEGPVAAAAGLFARFTRR